MVQDEISHGTNPAYEHVLKIIRDCDAGEGVDFFGGEPTLFPRFWELLELAAGRGHHVSVATNARIFCAHQTAERVARYGVAIRSSLYGHTGELHDSITRCRGSFRETVEGLANLVAAGCAPVVNIVMLKENIRHLTDITHLLMKIGVRRIKYSTFIKGACSPGSIPPLDEVRVFLKEALAFVCGRDIGIMIEKSPLCMLEEFINWHIPETDPEMVGNCASTFVKLEPCQGCVLNRACIGIDRDYAKTHGEKGLLPFQECPEFSKEVIDLDSFESYAPKYYSNFLAIRLTGSDISEESILKLARIQESIKKIPGCHLIGYA
jgi:hypothetical protein